MDASKQGNGPHDAGPKRVQTRPPSFPAAAVDTLLSGEAGRVWQVLAGDGGHWRVGLYSPAHTAPGEIVELERHDCPELFVLLSGRLTLLLAEPGGVRELALEPGRPALVVSPHDGFCPDGPHRGVALVVERDSFDTEYRTQQGWR